MVPAAIVILLILSGKQMLANISVPRVHGLAYDTPEAIHDDRRTDVALREEILKLALLVNGVNVVHGGGAVSVAHGEKDIDATIAAYREAARLFKKYLY